MYPQTLGVFRKTSGEDIGTGTTSRRSKQQTFWYVRRLDVEQFEVQPLNPNHVPSGVKTVLTKGVFLENFDPESRFYETHTIPALKSLQRKVELGEQFFQKGLLSKAEKEFLKAIMIDEENARANLGLGAVYCEQNEFQKLQKVMKVLLGNDEVFQEEQRVQFNTFGISLRKHGRHQDAIRFYDRALEIGDEDEHLHFNMARAQYEMGDKTKCRQYIESALALNPQFSEGQKFLDYLVSHG